MGKKNIRLDALPHDRRAADRDCRSCIKRRIQCDRTLPACHKCQSRDIACPGFEQSLKWIDGLANRSKSREQRRQQESAAGNDQNHNDSDVVVFQPDTSRISSDLGLGSRSMVQTLSSRLVLHFLTHVTPRLQWVDHENPWRHLLFPLSRTSPALQLAIMSQSAAHLSVIQTTTTEHADAFRRIYQSLLRETLRLMTGQIRRQLANTDSESMESAGKSTNASRNTEMLATMFVLCHLEMLFPDSQAWNVHLRAFRIAADRDHLSRNRSATVDPLILFLKQSVANIHGAFKFPSTEEAEKPPSLQTPVEQQTFGDKIWAFTTIVREVSDLEREIYQQRQGGSYAVEIDMAPWRSRLDLAHMMALSSTSSLWAGVSATRNVFCKVVSSHHYAGLIYSYQALRTLDYAADPALVSAFEKLIQELQAVKTSAVRDFDQDLFWPLFIAGTECRANEAHQKLVHETFWQLLTSTGLWCNSKALRFLKLFWSDTAATQTQINWIQHARNVEPEFGSFLVY